MKLLSKFLAHGELEYTHKKLGLDRVRSVLDFLGNPESAYPSVLIAGTNGKGSVGCMLESVLGEAGYSVGLYTSPHLSRFTERIRVGGEEVSESELEEVLEWFESENLLDEDGSLKIPSGDTLTWFEKVTLLAFEIFRRRGVSLALLEVGLGGRLDATNVVDPLVSVITSVSLDHTEVLGDSVFEIAREKLGVMRKGKPLVIGPMDQKVQNFLVKATRIGEAVPVTPSIPQGSWREFSYSPFDRLSLGMRGEVQLKNAATSIEVLIQLKERGFEIQNVHVRDGLKKAHFPGRLEVVEGIPAILFDGAHNFEALEALVHEIREGFPEKKVTIVFGMMGEKNPREALELFSSLKPKFHFTEINSPRTIPIERWEELCNVLKIEGEFFRDSREAFRLACERADEDSLIVVTGSLYLMGKLRKED